MIHYFTNREIAEKLYVNLARWKRWTRSFLPPDPLGGLQSGYARQYVFKDLFKVYLGGYLLSHLKLSVNDAQTLISDLSPWLKKNGFLELNGSIEKMKAKAGLENPCRIYFKKIQSEEGKKAAAFGYLIQKTVSCQRGGEDNRQLTQTVEETILGCDNGDGQTFLETPTVYLINISALFYELVDRTSS